MLVPFGLLLVGTITATAPVAIFPLEGTNLHPGHVQAARAVLKLHVEELGSATQLVEPGEAAWASAAEQVALVAPLGVERYLTGTMMRLGERVKTRLVLHDATDGHVLGSAMLDADSPEDLDVVLLRLAEHLLRGKPLAQARIDEVTEHEQQAYGRKTSNNYFGVQVIGSLPGAKGLSAGGMGAGGGLYWLYDARDWMGEIAVYLAGGSDCLHTGAGINFLYPFFDLDYTPYLGLGLSYSGTSLEWEGGAGLASQAIIGFMFGRTNTVHVRLDLRPFINFYKIDGNVSGGLDFSLGLGF